MPTRLLVLRHNAGVSLRIALLGCAGAVALSGCASRGDSYSATDDGMCAQEVPAQWSSTDAVATATGNSLVAWWRRFDDPLLDALVERALQSNTSIDGARAALRLARAQRDISAAALWPVVDASASAQRAAGGEAGTANRIALGLDAQWNPDLSGANHHALAASSATAAASAASLGDIQVAIAAEVGSNYFVLRNAQARRAIASASLASQDETLQLTRWREQAGLVTALETAQAQASSAQTRAQLPLLDASIEQAMHALAVLGGQPPAALNAELAPLRPMPQDTAPVDIGIPAETLRQRADVRAAEFDVLAATARLRQSQAQRLPDFSLAGSLGSSGSTLSRLVSGAPLLSTLLASASVALFDGGAARAQVRAQRATLDQADAAYRAVVLAALQEVEDALAVLRGERARLASLRTAAEAATSAAVLARQRYSSGLVDFQTVLETQRNQFATDDSVASSSAQVGLDLVRLFAALGGGWRSDETGDDPALAFAGVVDPSAAARR